MLTRSSIRLLLTALVLYGCALGLVSEASAQARKNKPIRDIESEQEREDDPPAGFWGTGYSPAKSVVEGGFVSHQVNVNLNGQNVVGDAANEPSITVNPFDRNKMAVGWRQFNSVTSNFRQAGYAYSTDGGLTWTFPGNIEPGVFRSDPVLAADNDGQFFYLSLQSGFFDTMFFSSDGGQTWLDPVFANGGDKQWFTIDNTSSPGRGFQYQAWSVAGNNWEGRQFSRSTDGGRTWSDPVNILESPSWGTLDVDSNGILYIGGVDLFTGNIWCVRSSNARDGKVTPSFDQSTLVDLGGSVSVQEPINPEGLLGQTFLAVDRSGTSTNNNVYMIASVIPTGFATGSDVMFARSTDGGQSFENPVRINDDPVDHNKWHWMASFAVAPNGRIDAVWLDTRNAANNTDSQLYYSYSTDGGVTWSANVAASPSFDPFIGYPNQQKLGDYLTIVSDNDGGDVAYPATFNGEEDVYYLRVAPEGEGSPTPTPTATATATATATSTSTPTATATATPTSTATSTPTSTATPTATATSTATPTATSTATATATSTPAATASPTPTAASRTAFDYDGDQRSDVSTYRPSEGNWYLSRSASGFFAVNFGLATDRLVPADYDDDGRTDIAVYRPSEGTWYILNSSNGTFSAANFGVASDHPAPADYDGDGNADLAVFRPGEGAWYIANSSSGTFTVYQWGQNGDIPAIGDLDGDRRADISIYRPETSTWWSIHSSDGTFHGEQFGLTSDKIVPGDYDGDGKTDLAVYRPSEGNWYIRFSATSTFGGFNFGLADDIPSPGDFDGDGGADRAVFRPSNGKWYITRSSDGSFIDADFGTAGDIPTQSAYGN